MASEWIAERLLPLFQSPLLDRVSLTCLPVPSSRKDMKYLRELGVRFHDDDDDDDEKYQDHKKKKQKGWCSWWWNGGILNRIFGVGRMSQVELPKGWGVFENCVHGTHWNGFLMDDKFRERSSITWISEGLNFVDRAKLVVEHDDDKFQLNLNEVEQRESDGIWISKPKK